MCLFSRARGENRTLPGRFADVNWDRDQSTSELQGDGRRGRRAGDAGGTKGWEKEGETERVPTDCCGCLPTTRVSDNVVVAVADIFLIIIFLSVVSASLSAESVSPQTTRDLGN